MTVPDQHHVLERGAAIGAIAPRSAIGLSGKDRAAYLQGLLTNDIQALQPGSGCYAAWLTPQGRMVTDMHVFESGDMMLLDVPADLLAATLQRLDQFLFSEDVQFADLSSSLAAVWIHGPEAPGIVERALTGTGELGSWANYRNARAEFEGAPVVVARVDQLGAPGFVIYLEPSREPDLQRALTAMGAVAVGQEAIDAARIAAGYPLFGADMTGDTIPLEAGIESSAISLTKGCYVGQEVIIRVLHRGQGRVAKRLVGIRAEAGVRAGSKIYSERREVGTVTSAATSPRLGSIALGYVHRDFVQPGTPVTVEVDGTHVAAVVTARPIS
jgi:folate-binding protein YgfZ